MSGPMDVEMANEAPRTDEKLAQMRARLAEVMKREPGALIVFADYGQDLEVVAIGGELDVRALHTEGTKTLAKMLLQSHAAVEEARPERLN